MKKNIVFIIIGVIIVVCISFFIVNHFSVKENENSKNISDGIDEHYSYKNQNGDDIEIIADKVVTATGFAGASNFKFYLRKNDLYFENISIENSRERIATNVLDLYLEEEQVVAKLGNDGKIIKDNNYVKYIE